MKGMTVSTISNGHMPASKLIKLKDYDAEISKLKREKELAEAADKMKAEKDAENNRAYAIQCKTEAEMWEAKAKMYKEREDIDEALTNAARCKRAYEEMVEVKEAVAEDTDVPSVWERILGHAGTLWVALAMFLAMAGVCYKMVHKLGAEITSINAAANASGDLSAMVPPSVGLMTFQKGWFTWMTISLDLVALLVMMVLIAPDKLYYILPFTKDSKNKAWKGFNGLEEGSKQWLAFGYIAVFLLFLALSHLGGK